MDEGQDMIEQIEALKKCVESIYIKQFHFEQVRKFIRQLLVLTGTLLVFTACYCVINNKWIELLIGINELFIGVIYTVEVVKESKLNDTVVSNESIKNKIMIGILMAVLIRMLMFTVLSGMSYVVRNASAYVISSLIIIYLVTDMNLKKSVKYEYELYQYLKNAFLKKNIYHNDLIIHIENDRKIIAYNRNNFEKYVVFKVKDGKVVMGELHRLSKSGIEAAENWLKQNKNMIHGIG